MPITLGTNIASLGAQRRLAATGDRIASVYERLSSGQRINRASDDAAGLAVSSSLNVNTRVYTQAIRNVNDGVSALSIADQAIAELSSVVTRQTELAEQAANGIYSTAQRTAMDREAQALNQEYSRIAATTQFNGIRLIDGTTNGINLQAGFGLNGVISAQIFAQSSSSPLTDSGTLTNTDYTLADLGDGVTNFGFLKGDLNGDGFIDLVTVHSSSNFDSGSFFVNVYQGSSSGTMTLVGATQHDYSAPGEQIGFSVVTGSIGDTYGADGKLDIRIRYTATSDLGTINLIEREEFNNTTVGTTFNWNTALDDNLQPAANGLTAGGASYGDFNGDGFADDVSVTATGFRVGIHNTSGGGSGAIDDLAQSSFSLTTQSGARSALTSFDSLSTELSQNRGRIGAALSRIASASAVLQAATTNFAAAQSRILNADVASDSAELTRSTILQNVGSAVLAQANQQPEIALRLLKI